MSKKTRNLFNLVLVVCNFLAANCQLSSSNFLLKNVDILKFKFQQASTKLPSFRRCWSKKICESNFNIDEMENQPVQKKMKNAQAKTEIGFFLTEFFYTK